MHAPLTSPDELNVAFLSRALGETVTAFTYTAERSNWARHAAIRATRADGTTQALRLKLCGDTFGRSEVDYYTRDYVGMVDAPLVRCHDAAYAAGVGYHLLLDDLSATHHDRKLVPPTLAHGLALARALGRLHAHHWGTGTPPDQAAQDRYFAEIRPGVAGLERATGRPYAARFEAHAAALRARWADPRGLTLIHGDVNPTNVLTPRDAETPLYFLDRQPFDWSFTHALAVSDLAYATAPWWPPAFRIQHEAAILRAWHEALGQPDYAWERAQADYALCVEQCLHVPMEWCANPENVEKMRWLWEWQLGNLQGGPVQPPPHAPPKPRRSVDPAV